MKWRRMSERLNKRENIAKCQYNINNINKCIGDDTKAAARQSPNCIKKTKINKIWRKTIFNMEDGILTPFNVARSWHCFRQVTAPCNVACGSVIMTVNSSSGSRSTLQRDTWLWDDMSLNSPGGSTLQCGRWLWDDIPLNSPKRPSYWNSTSGFDFGHITTVDMSFCTSLRNFIEIGPPSAEKNDVKSILKMADLRHLGF